MKALIDGDIVCYRAGFASDAGAKKAGIEAEDVSHCLHSVKLVINDIVESVGANDVAIYLTGPNNFRNQLATIQPYKDRPSRKPFHYQAIRDYLVDVWDAEISDGNEADDLLGINQNDNTCICSIDKDLLMIPGYHYNFVKKEYYDIDSVTALQTFYKQLMTGDSTDTIPGIQGCGPKTAEKIMKGAQTETEMWHRARQHYYKKAPHYTDDNILEIGQLLWIQRADRMIWNPPSI